MKKFLASFFIAVLVVGGFAIYDFIFDRAPPHRFDVNLDEPARSVMLTLGNSDGNQTTQMIGKDKRFHDSRDIADSSGKILVIFKDGTSLKCSVDYVTNGEIEPHKVSISNRQCPEIGSHVQNY